MILNTAVQGPSEIFLKSQNNKVKTKLSIYENNVESDDNSENSKFMNFKLPTESQKNNKFFHPIISNSKYLRTLKLKNLPILPNSKDYRRNIGLYKKKLAITSNEIRKYTELLRENQNMNCSSPTQLTQVDTADLLQYSPRQHRSQCTLTIEVIRAWNTSKSKSKISVPVIEIQKLSEFEYGDDVSMHTSSTACKVNGNDIIWSQVFELNFNSKVSDVHKKFRISLFQKDKSKRNVQVGRSYTISVLTNLDDQNVTFKTFEFGNSLDQVEWCVATRIQFISDKPTLFKDILEKLGEKQHLLENILERVQTQMKTKLSGDANGPQEGNEDKYGSVVRTSKAANLNKLPSASQHAGYYSSSKSAGYS